MKFFTVKKGSDVGIIIFDDSHYGLLDGTFMLQEEMRFSEDRLIGMGRCEKEGCDCNEVMIDFYRDEKSRYRVYGLDNVAIQNWTVLQ
jgi:hypothetical protein